MIGRRAIIGLSLLSALVFCAFAAPNAMAVKGTTAFTCVKVAAGVPSQFEDEHCTKEKISTGQFVHAVSPLGTNTPVIVSNNITGAQNSLLKLKGVLGGVELELESKKFADKGKTSLTNKENAAEQMEATGGNDGQFSEITVVKPANCTVATVNLIEGTGQTKVVGTEMWVEFTTAGGIFANFELSGEKCALKGSKIEVKGTAKANVSTSETALDGATLQFTKAQTEKTLQVGGKPASFEGQFTVRNKTSNTPLVSTTQPT
jgi:hypothetical protein